MRKECTNCKIEKDVKYFYKRKNGLYGTHAQCRSCLIDKNKTYRNKNKEKISIRDFMYREKLKEKYKGCAPRTIVRLPERSILGFERYAEKKMQLLAGSLLNYGIRIGMIKKPDCCSICKSKGEIQGHHPDYSKPLQVIWVCIKCHMKFHKQ
jgi:hypothetical protein